MKRAGYGAIAVVAISAWFAASNHCAFAALTTSSVQTGCPFHSKPTKQEQQPTGVQCCKILRAVAPFATKNWARDDANFSSADGCWNECLISIAHLQTMLAPLFLDTGPPDARSFAELILQKSLFAHAPPSLA
jgi:hypothetical protein